MSVLVDADARRIAATEFGRTVVVTAGAGTGKTALLVERTLNILFREEEVAVTELLALTFSKKAAAEMRVRVREAIARFLEWSMEEGGPPESAGHLGSIYRGIMERYGLPAEAVTSRALEALGALERAPISTMHSFAGQALRRHPVEADVDPGFAEDDGLAFAEAFGAAWERFLLAELASGAPRTALWNDVLEHLSLGDVTELARMLSDEDAPLDALTEAAESGRLFRADGEWLAELSADARGLIETHKKRLKLHDGLDAAIAIFDSAAKGAYGCSEADEEALADQSRLPAGWEENELERARVILRVARSLACVNVGAIGGAVELVAGFARDFRYAFARGGSLSFGALLVRTRDLLRDHPEVREEFKRRYRYVLVDEFQDTDPLQYEIVFYLAERAGESARDWRECRLEPGKLFIVGDPKQSIYRFRGADISAYREVVEDRLSDEAVRLSLVTNFRSCEGVIDAANGIFERMIVESPGIQPAYEALAARPGVEGTGPKAVEILLVEPPSDKANAAELARAEACAVAALLADEIIGREELPDGRVRPGDVAILLRKMTAVGNLTDALEARGIPYVVEGEKSFYTAQEVTDLLNILMALSDPHDKTALVGALRSAACGLTDLDIARMSEAGRLDYQDERPLPRSLDRAECVFAVMREIHARLRCLDPARAVDLVFDALPVVEASVASGGGERARANLHKIRRMAFDLGSRPEMTLREFVALVRGRAEDMVEEGESPLAEESSDAVNIMTIHKAKGLEFPVVVMPGLHSGLRGQENRCWARAGWRGGEIGLRTGGLWTPGAVRMAETERLMDEAEELRVFYVGVTRARERLIFTAAPGARRSSGNMLEKLEEIIAFPPGTGEETISAGRGSIRVRRVAAPEVGLRRRGGRARPLSPSEIDAWASRWALRRRRCSETEAARLFASPSAHSPMAQRGGAVVGASRADSVEAALVGTLAHAAMQRLDLSLDDPRDELARLIDEEIDALERDRGARDLLRAETREAVAGLYPSEAWTWLHGAETLGREIPALFDWPEGDRTAAAEGVIDLLVRTPAGLAVVDWKTDRVSAEDARKRSQVYAMQAAMYRRAVERATGTEVSEVHLIFVRTGTMVSVHPNSIYSALTGYRRYQSQDSMP